MSDPVQYVWIRVGDGNPEPAALEGVEPNRKVTTIGCPDAYMIDEPDCPAWLVYHGCGFELDVIDLPDDPITAKEAAKRERAYRKAISNRHSYAGFGRRNRP